MADSGEFALPRLKEIFASLSRGRHITALDAQLFQALGKHQAGFTKLFQQLGFELISDSRGFYYFLGGESQPIARRTRRQAVFIYILVESLWESAQDIADLETQLFETEWSVGALPHLRRSRYRELLQGADPEQPDEDTLLGILNGLVRFGFAARVSDDVFKFQAPIHRFLDLAREMAQTLDSVKPEAPSEPEWS